MKLIDEHHNIRMYDNYNYASRSPRLSIHRIDTTNLTTRWLKTIKTDGRKQKWQTNIEFRFLFAVDNNSFVFLNILCRFHISG